MLPEILSGPRPLCNGTPQVIASFVLDMAYNRNANQNHENELDIYDNYIHVLEFSSLKGVDVI
jgi:hypothetical protein